MIGLIFGDTDFPNEILKTIKKRKIKYLIIDLSKSKNLKKIKNLIQFLLVNLVKLLIFLKKIIVKKYYLLEK